MKAKLIPYVILTVLLSSMFLTFIVPIKAQSDVPLKVTRAVWGQSLDSPIEVYPGDTGVALTVEVQNLSPNQTIKGVSGLLMLKNTPFTDTYGNSNATATGVPTIGEILNPTDEIKPKGFLTMTFTLDVDENAFPGTFTLSMPISYSASEGVDFVEGIPQALSVVCQISFAESTVTVSAAPATLDIGETVRVTGNIQPAQDNVTVTLGYKRPDETEYVEVTNTKSDGSFTASYTPEIDGAWTLNASWTGDARHLGNWGLISFEARLPVSLEMSLVNNRLKAGYDNQLNITVRNNGKVAFSDLQFSVTIPAPLVVTDKNQWTLNYLDEDGSYSIPVQIFVPSSSIGSTYSGGLAVSCRDDYGTSQTYNFPVGLIIVGNLEMNAYDSSVKPLLATNGSKVEITMTLLNKGTVLARYVNASILSNAILVLTPESAAYVGDVEENSQTPFTLAVNVSSMAQTGTYPVTVRISYRNDQNIDDSFDVTVYVHVDTTKFSGKSEGTLGFPDMLSQTGAILVTIVMASAIIMILYRKQSRKSNQKARADR